jgi:alpha/beta superfamily hydrolase
MSVSDLMTRVRTHPILGRVFRFRPIAIVAGVLIVLATATATADAPTGSIIYGRVKAQDVRLSMPPTEHPKGIAIFFHGQNGGVDNRMDDPWLQSLVSAGWVVASSDFHTDSWGNEASTEDTENLIAWAEEQTDDLPIRMYVSGSMGGSVSLNAMIHGTDPEPPCWYGVKPAIDLTKMTNVPGATRIIKEAYAGAVPFDRNPINTMDELPTSTRYRFVTSPEDTWVTEADNTAKISAALQARGADVSVFVVHGTHDDPSHFDNEDLLAFAKTCEDAAPTAGGDTARAAG